MVAILSPKAMPSEEPSPGSLRPGDNDVLFGRGGGIYNHTGNVKFRKLVADYKAKYALCPQRQKYKIAESLMSIWYSLDPPGRFLERVSCGPGTNCSVTDEDTVWCKVSNQKAFTKISRCLRERNSNNNASDTPLTDEGELDLAFCQPVPPVVTPKACDSKGVSVLSRVRANVPLMPEMRTRGNHDEEKVILRPRIQPRNLSWHTEGFAPGPNTAFSPPDINTSHSIGTMCGHLQPAWVPYEQSERRVHAPVDMPPAYYFGGQACSADNARFHLPSQVSPPQGMVTLRGSFRGVSNGYPGTWREATMLPAFQHPGTPIIPRRVSAPAFQRPTQVQSSLQYPTLPCRFENIERCQCWTTDMNDYQGKLETFMEKVKDRGIMTEEDYGKSNATGEDDHEEAVTSGDHRSEPIPYWNVAFDDRSVGDTESDVEEFLVTREGSLTPLFAETSSTEISLLHSAGISEVKMKDHDLCCEKRGKEE